MDAPAGERLAGDLAAISAAARDLGVSPGDPAYPFVVGIERMLGELAAKLDAHETALAKMAGQIADTAGQRIADAADRSARSMVEFHHAAAKLADRKWFWKASWIGAAALAGAAAVFGLAGFYYGRESAPIMATVHVQQGAGFVAEIATLNDSGSLWEYCLQHRTTPDAAGNPQCLLPPVRFMRTTTHAQTEGNGMPRQHQGTKQ